MRIVYICHRVEGEVLHNLERVKAVCRMLASVDVYPLAPYLGLFQFLNDRAPEEMLMLRSYTKALFDKRVMDEVWICSEPDARVRQELRWAAACNIKVIDAYKDSSQVTWMKDTVFALNTEIRNWAKKGLEAELKGHNLPEEEHNDKSGITERIDENLNTAVAVVRHRIRSISDKVVNTDAFPPESE